MFLRVDIYEYYSSINEMKLNYALFFAKNDVGIPIEDTDIIKLLTKFILEYRHKYWIRKDAMDSFDLPIGSPNSSKFSYILTLRTQ